MKDFANWISRQQAFIEEMKKLPGTLDLTLGTPPDLDARELERLTSRLRIPMPEVLKPIVLTRPSDYCYKYVWKPPGEYCSTVRQLFTSSSPVWGAACLCDAHMFEYMQGGCWEWSENWKEPDAELWKRSFPWVAIGNGDYLALDVAVDPIDPPVVYLSHDGEGESCTLANSIAEFLSTWERIAYVGPDIVMFINFRDPVTGLLRADTPAREELVTLFSPILK